MIKIIIAVVIFLHGLIHLMGFAKNLNLAEVGELSGKTIVPLSETAVKVAGFIWLTACLFFAASAFGLLLGKQWWWGIGICGMILSQMLIILYWKDAWAGTIANVIILIAVILSAAYSNSQRMLSADIERFLSRADHSRAMVVTGEMLDELPLPVKNYLEKTGVIGKTIPATVRLIQSGRLRETKEKPWMEFRAEEYFTIDPPGFLWIGTVSKLSLPMMQVRDSYRDGKGGMQFRIGSIFKAGNLTGPEMDDATLMRYLNEMMWFPAAFLSDHIAFESIDSASAKISITCEDKTASAELIFDDEGQLVNFIAGRHRKIDDRFEIESWSTPIDTYSVKENLHLPLGGAGVWLLDEGDLEYIQLQIEEIEYNVRRRY